MAEELHGVRPLHLLHLHPAAGAGGGAGGGAEHAPPAPPHLSFPRLVSLVLQILHGELVACGGGGQGREVPRGQDVLRVLGQLAAPVRAAAGPRPRPPVQLGVAGGGGGGGGRRLGGGGAHGVERVAWGGGGAGRGDGHPHPRHHARGGGGLQPGVGGELLQLDAVLHVDLDAASDQVLALLGHPVPEPQLRAADLLVTLEGDVPADL